MISKDEFLANTNENEVFSIVEEFLIRLSELKEEYTRFTILDRDSYEIAIKMIDERQSKEKTNEQQETEKNKRADESSNIADTVSNLLETK